MSPEKGSSQDIITYMIALPPVEVLERLKTIDDPPPNAWNYLQQYGMFDTRANPPFWITVQGNEKEMAISYGR